MTAHQSTAHRISISNEYRCHRRRHCCCYWWWWWRWRWWRWWHCWRRRDRCFCCLYYHSRSLLIWSSPPSVHCPPLTDSRCEAGSTLFLHGVCMLRQRRLYMVSVHTSST